MKDLLDHLVGRLARMIVRALPATCESGFAALAVAASPEVEGRSRDPKTPAGRVDVAVLLRVLDDSPLPPEFPLIFDHLDPLGQPLSS